MEVFAAECRERSRCEMSPDLTLGAQVVLPWLQYSGAPLGSFTFELGLLKLNTPEFQNKDIPPMKPH